MGLTGRLLLGAALAAAFTGVVVQYSVRHGRLLLPPEYDDVFYFADAAERVVVLEESRNLGAFVKHTLSSPPHSPLATFLALAGFLIFGIKEWAPYAANGILVLVLLGMVDYLFRERSLGVRVATAVLVLALPWTSLLVFEFRPDPACAVMVGFGVALALEQDLVRASRRRRCAVGAAFGLAILFKPSFLVFAGALMAATFVATLVAGPSRLREALRAWVWVAAAMMAVGGLPLALQPRHYFNYLLRGLFAPPIAPHPGGWKEQALYYLTGNPGYLMRGEHLALLVGAFLASVAMLAYRGRWDRYRLVLVALVPVAVAYLLPTLASVKQPYFGVMFAALSTFAILRALAELTGAYGAGLAIVAALAGLWWAKPPPRWGSASDATVKQRRRLVGEVYAAVRGRLDRPGVAIYVTAEGTVSPELLRFNAIRDGLSLPFARGGGSGRPDEVRRIIDWADLVIAPAPGATEVAPNTPAARRRAETLAAVRAHPSLLLFRTVEGDGGAYYLFERIGPFHGFHDPRGLLDVEGPYPQWGLGLVRWGLGPETTLGVEAERPARFQLSLEGRPASPGLEVKLFLDGETIARHVFQDPRRFEKLEVPVDVPAGKHSLKIVYSDWTRRPGEPSRALLFSGLRFLPVS
jgi:hypothetical protein